MVDLERLENRLWRVNIVGTILTELDSGGNWNGDIALQRLNFTFGFGLYMSVMQIVDGWLEGVEHCPSPNCNERPVYKCQPRQPELLVIHNISLPPKRFGGNYIQQFFQNNLPADAHPYFSEIAELTVSAHLLIDRNGQLTQFVPFEKRAWHAGVSEYCGQSNCNDFSIGIELEGADDIPYTFEQYEALVNVSAALLAHYPLMTPQDITGHSDIAPQRKTDPGPAFNWDYFQRLLAAKIERLPGIAREIK